MERYPHNCQLSQPSSTFLQRSSRSQRPANRLVDEKAKAAEAAASYHAISEHDYSTKRHKSNIANDIQLTTSAAYDHTYGREKKVALKSSSWL